MEKNLQVFNYNDIPISFELGNGNVMINATQMAKPFRKQTSDWTRLQQTEDFLSSLSAVRGIPRSELIRVVRGGNGLQGTMFHEDVALEFARWLSPLFAIWCNDRIKELMRHGMTATPEVCSRAVWDPRFVLQLLDQVREGYRQGLLLRQENDLLAGKLEAQAHKVAFYNNVHRCLSPESARKVYRVSQIAFELGIKAPELNRFLEQKGVQYKYGKAWKLHPEYRNRGYTRDKTFQGGYDEEGEPVYGTFMVWTARGRDFVLRLFDQ